MTIKVAIFGDVARIFVSSLDGDDRFRLVGRDALEGVPESPDIILVSDREDPIAALGRISPAQSGVPRIWIRQSGQVSKLRHLLRCGVVGSLPPKSTPQEIKASVLTVANGGFCFETQQLLELNSVVPSNLKPHSADAQLSAREKETMLLLLRGETDKEIAPILQIAPATVRSRLRSIFKKLQVHTRAEAVKKYWRMKRAAKA